MDPIITIENNIITTMKTNEKDDTCAICLDNFSQKDVRNLKCNHVFHTICINQWEKKGMTTCPVCRDVFVNHCYKIRQWCMALAPPLILLMIPLIIMLVMRYSK